MLKTCSNCKEVKSIDDFYFVGKRRPGLKRTWCKDCDYLRGKEWSQNNKSRLNKNRAARRAINPVVAAAKERNSRYKSKYGITLEEFLQMEELQNGFCAICKEPESVIDSKTRNIRSLHVDHDHVTGQVRGLLCSSCNAALGHIHDRPEIAMELYHYLVANGHAEIPAKEFFFE